MNAAQGILTSRGGMTSHAALVARQMGKVCVAGCGELDINYRTKTIKIKGMTIKEGDYISINGSTGEVFAGEVKTIPSEVLRVLVDKTLKPEESPIYQDFDSLMKWADEARRLGVRTNADQPDQARVAIAFGAEGIGLCRTEHMFFEGTRIDAVREMIVAEDLEGRKKALAKVLPMQKGDFAGLFKVMNGLPVTIRTLDPPLHEFLPHGEKELRDLAAKMGITYERLATTVAGLQEENPMLGLRGCRLGILYPEITEMQARALFEAACEVKKSGIDVKPEIMIPLVSDVNELKLQKDVVDRVASEVFAVVRHERRLQGGHDDRDTEGGAYRRRDRDRGGVFLLRHERPHPDHLRHEQGRRGENPAPLRGAGRARIRPLPAARRARRGEAHENRGGAGQEGAAQAQDGHLRRARRRAELGQVLPQAGPRLRKLLALPGHGSASRRGPGGDRGEKGEEISANEVLLHICCAPCTIYPLKVLRGEGHETTGFFYNPNIHPYTEFQRRQEALSAYSRVSLLPLIIDETYDLHTFLRAALDAGADRCAACYRLRLEAAFRKAVDEKATR